MEHFLQIQEGTDKAEGTIRIYQSRLEQFSEWLEHEGLTYDEVNHRDVKRYLTCLKNEIDYAPQIIWGRFTAISQFYKDITENGANFYDTTDPVRIAEYATKTPRKGR